MLETILETTQCNIDISEVVNTGKFDFYEAQDHPLWAHELLILKITSLKQKNMAL